MTRRTDIPGGTNGAHVPGASSLRIDRVTLARERIRQRFYDRADVRRALVEALLVELAL
jgi:hypothetical protein